MDENIICYTSEELKTRNARGKSKNNWTKVGAMTDEKLEAIIASDPDDEEAIGPDWEDLDLTRGVRLA